MCRSDIRVLVGPTSGIAPTYHSEGTRSIRAVFRGLSKLKGSYAVADSPHGGRRFSRRTHERGMRDTSAVQTRATQRPSWAGGDGGRRTQERHAQPARLRQGQPFEIRDGEAPRRRPVQHELTCAQAGTPDGKLMRAPLLLLPPSSPSSGLLVSSPRRDRLLTGSDWSGGGLSRGDAWPHLAQLVTSAVDSGCRR